MDGRRVAVITGASQGVGRATARLFASEGWDVGLIARGQAGLEGAAEEARRLGARAVIVQCDVADAAQVEQAADDIEETLGPIDVWVNDAMASVFAPVSKLKPSEIRRVTEVTYLGAVYGTMAALKRMTPRNRGVVVQVGSAVSYRGIPLQAAYSGAKYALRGFTEALRAELIHERSNVEVTIVHLPAVNTPQFLASRSKMPVSPRPLAPVFQPEVAARAIMAAALRPRRQLMFGAKAAAAAHANALMPGFLDRYLARFGWAGQQRSVPNGHEGNLWRPADDTRDLGAHGPFDDEASPVSPDLWRRIHPVAATLVVAAFAGAAWAALSRRRARRV